MESALWFVYGLICGGVLVLVVLVIAAALRSSQFTRILEKRR